MRVRTLQIKDDDGQWYDEGYAFEDETGQIFFRYNLLWERIGSFYNGKLKETGVSLEAIETVIEPNNDALRWLPIAVVEADQVETYLEQLDEACAIPKPQPISLTKALSL
jgi:hypothetical protein